MSCGQPMPQEMQDEIREIVERAAGPEIVAAIRESQRRVREMWEHMTDEEIANWIMGEGV